MATNVFRRNDGTVELEVPRSEAQQKARKVKELRQEASRLSSMANKRIARLERNKLTDTPAYQQYIRSGGKRFGVKGKTYNEVQKELARLRNFISAETSTVRGAYNTLKQMAVNVGIEYSDMKDLTRKAPQFFELASKVEQYLRNVDDMASAIGYQKIWEAVNQFVKEQNIDLSSADADLEGMIAKVSDLVKETTHQGVEVSGWYTVNK